MARQSTPLRQSLAITPPPRLVPVDQFYMYTVGYDSAYLYGLKNGASFVLQRRDINKNITALLDMATLKDDVGVVLTTPTLDGVLSPAAGVLLATMGDTTSTKAFVYKSVDGGQNFGANAPLFNDLKPVLALPATVSLVYNQTLCSFTDSTGAAKIIAGWYSVASGGFNQLKIQQSTDAGTTWTTLFDSNLWARHVHVIKQDPYTKNIWIGTGDTSPQSGILVWDGVSAWPAINSAWATIAATPGFQANYGLPNMRPLSFMFDANSVFWGADTDFNLPTQYQGIWAAPKATFATAKPTQLDTSIVPLGNVAHGFGLKLSTGQFILGDFPTAADGTPQHNNMWTSADGYTWALSHCQTILAAKAAAAGGRHCRFLFEWPANPGVAYLSSSGIWAGPWTQTTVAVKPDGIFDGIMPEPLFPCVWVAPIGGLDSATASPNGMQYGYTPDYPWATVNYVWGTNHVTYGTRAIMQKGLHTTGAAGLFPIAWTLYSLPATAGEPLYLTCDFGQSALTTTFQESATATYLFYADNVASSPVVVRGITGILGLGSTQVVSGGTIPQSNYDFERCILGASTESPSSAVVSARGSKIRLRNTKVIAGAGAVGVNISSTAIAPEMYSSVIQGGASGVISAIAAGFSAQFDNCLIFGQSTRGLQGATGVPFIVRSTIIWEPSLVAITHAAGTNYDLTTFSNNAINGTLTNTTGITGASFGSITLAALPYTDAANGNFTVTDQTIDGKGRPLRSAVPFDFSGNRVNNPTSVGPIEAFPSVQRRMG